MPTLDINGTTLHYIERGMGPDTIVFCHGYLLDSSHFDAQIDELSEQHRCIAFDHRGHGKSERPTDGYHLENLFADAVGVIEALGGGPVHFVGLSTGGFIGLRLGIRRPDLLQSLTLLSTSATSENAWRLLKYEAMLRTIRATGFSLLGPYLTSLNFARRTRADPAQRHVVEQFRETLERNDRGVALAFGRAVVHRKSVLEQVHRIEVPTTVVVGQEDTIQPVAQARLIAERVRDATLVLIPAASHLCTVEQPYYVTEAILDVIARSSPELRDTPPQAQL